MQGRVNKHETMIIVKKIVINKHKRIYLPIKPGSSATAVQCEISATTCGVDFGLNILQERTNIDKSAKTEVPPSIFLQIFFSSTSPNMSLIVANFPLLNVTVSYIH